MGRLIGIGGRLAAGKDTVADYLVGKGWIKFGMSDPLHQSMMKLNPIVDYYQDGALTYREVIEDFGYTEAKAEFYEVRRLLQVFGTEVGRDLFGENVWVDIMKRRAAAAMETQNVIVTGIRFINEVDAIRELGGELWWVDRGGNPLGDSHASENSVTFEDFDVLIGNTGTIGELYHEVDIYR